MHYILSYWISIQICNWDFDVGKTQISIGVGPEKNVFGLCLTFLFYTGVLGSKADWMAVNDAKGHIISEGYFGFLKSRNK